MNTPELWGGVECTINRVKNTYHNQLVLSGHWDRLDDLDRIAQLGIRRIRYPLLWEAIMPEERGPIDWSWADARMERLRELGMKPIIGLLHHGSGPAYTSLLDPKFPNRLAEYAEKIANRYPWIDAYTPVNEPLTTARFSCLYGLWFPHAKDPVSFFKALSNQLRGIILSMRAIRDINPKALLIQTEDLGEVYCSPGLEYQATYENERRWLSYDLLCGRVNLESPSFSYFRKADIPLADITQFVEEFCPPDIVGINHYVTSNRYLDKNIANYPEQMHNGNGDEQYVDIEAVRIRLNSPFDLSRLFRQVWERYKLPIAVTEAHLACTREEQIRWFEQFWRMACELRQKKIPLVAVTAWSLFGAYNWSSLLTNWDAAATRFANSYESGAFDLRSSKPRPTAFAKMLSTLAATSRIDSHLLQVPGWWQRDVRFLQMRCFKDQNSLLSDFVPKTQNSNNPVLLICGARGSLGRAFARLCYLRGLSYRLLTREQMDIANANSVRDMLSNENAWAIINAAGYVRVDDAEQEPQRCFRENTLGPRILAECCKEKGIQFVTFSSDLVFDGSKKAAYTEADSTAPLCTYGKSKAEAEKGVLETFSDSLVIRSSSYFSPWDKFNFVKKTYLALTRNQPVTAMEDVMISPTYVPDLVNATLDLLIDGESGIWNLTNQGRITWVDLARKVLRFTGITDERLVRGVPQQWMQLKARRPSNSSMTSIRGEQLPSLDDALNQFFSEIKESDHSGQEVG